MDPKKTVKNGKVRQKVRYKCKGCGLNFIEGNRRVKESLVVKKALAVLLYSLGKASFGMLGKIFGHSRSLTCRWIAGEAAKLQEPGISGDIHEIEFDEMWHFLQKNSETLDHQGRGSWLWANHCLGYGPS